MITPMLDVKECRRLEAMSPENAPVNGFSKLEISIKGRQLESPSQHMETTKCGPMFQPWGCGCLVIRDPTQKMTKPRQISKAAFRPWKLPPSFIGTDFNGQPLMFINAKKKTTRPSFWQQIPFSSRIESYEHYSSGLIYTIEAQFVLTNGGVSCFSL